MSGNGKVHRHGLSSQFRQCSTSGADIDTGKAQIECISDDALKHFKTYKYSSVDKSPLSNYVLKHYVLSPHCI